MTKRINFLKNTRQIAASRAGFKCSLPDCNRLTVGPGHGQEDIVLTGRASHIHSAVPGGPRGDGGLTPEQLRSTSNCIWLCADHAHEVDLKRGIHFPPALLLAYKDLHEARTAREQRGQQTALGWLHELRITQSPVFQPGSLLRLGKVTLLSGDNGSGKTAICQFLAGMSQPNELLRWASTRQITESANVILDIRSFNPTEFQTRIEVRSPGRIQYFLNGASVPFQPYPMRFIYLRTYHSFSREPDQDEIDIVSSILGIDSITIENLLPHVPMPNGRVLELSIRHVDGHRQLRNNLRHEKIDLPFLGRSHSQVASILIEIAAAMARASSKYVPTVLLLDGGVHTLDLTNLRRYALMLADSDHDFQTLVVLTNPPKDFSDIEWNGWQIARLIGSRREVNISQDW